MLGPRDVVAVVLCGGEGRRLGGTEKPLQVIAGRPLLARVVETIRPQASRVLISANRDIDRYAAYGDGIVADGHNAGRGPLAGIAAGLAAAGGRALLCVPGDAPHLPTDLLVRLDAARRAAATSIACVDDGTGPQPLCALIDGALESELQAYLDDGGRTPRQWYARHGPAMAGYDHWPLWSWSVNTPEEWRAATAALTALEIR